MKSLLIVVSQLDGNGPTGVETHFNLIMKSAEKRGADTLLISPHNNKPLLYKIITRIVKIIGYFNKEKSTLLSLKFRTFYLEKKISQVVRKKFNKRKIIIYAQDPHSIKAALKVRVYSEVRVIGVIHYNGSEASEMKVKGLTIEGGLLWNEMMRIESSVLPTVDKLIFVSKFMQSVVNNRLESIKNTSQLVIPNFASLPALKAKTYSLHSGDIITIGTLEPRKNQSFILYMLAECKLLGKKYKLTIIGDGPDRAKLEKLSIKLGISDQVTFLGFLKNAAEYIPSHKVLLHTAYIESFGIVLLEALSYKRPVLAPAVGGIPEVFSDGKEGFYLDLQSVSQSAGKLISLLENPQKLKKFSNNAENTFLKNFHPDILVPRWMEALFDD